MTEPDAIIEHRPAACAACQAPVAAGKGGAEVVTRERSQVQDLPPIQLYVTEHQALRVRCPACRHVTAGAFPPEAPSQAQYGPQPRSLAVYLVAQQFAPDARACDLLHDLYGAHLSVGTLVEWFQQSADTLKPVEEELKAAGDSPGRI